MVARRGAALALCASQRADVYEDILAASLRRDEPEPLVVPLRHGAPQLSWRRAGVHGGAPSALRDELMWLPLVRAGIVPFDNI